MLSQLRVSLRAVLISVSPILMFHAPAHSQSDGPLEARIAAAAKTIQDACSADVKTYCSNVTPGEGRLVLCMMAHEDKVSTKCEYSLFEASRNLERTLDRIEMTADACWNDIEKHCANLDAGGGRILNCLASKKASLQGSCQAALSKFPGK